jgi:ribose 1,5-bisphosphokinase
VLAQAQARYPRLIVLHLTATPEVLAGRLAARGREAAGDIAERLEGADMALPDGDWPVVTLDTDAPVGRLAKRAVRLVYGVKT